MNPIESIVDGTRNELVEMPWVEYLAYPALNGSVLVAGRKSMLHLHYAWHFGQADTDAMAFGRLLHCLLLEPREVEKRYRAWEGRRAGNEYKNFCARAEADGVEVVKASGEYSLELAVAASPRFFEVARIKELIVAGKAEQTVLCVEAGLQCKGRLDWVSTSEHVLTDVKTTAEMDERLFGRGFYRFGYDIKLGLYKRWLEAVTHEPWPVEVILLESKPPHDAAVMPVPDAVLDQGVEKALRIIERVKSCITAKYWPGIAEDGPYALHVPFYEMEAAEETEPFEG